MSSSIGFTAGSGLSQLADTDHPGRRTKPEGEAQRLLGLVADGKDPQAEKLEARERAAGTLGRVAADYLKHAKKKPKATQLFGD